MNMIVAMGIASALCILIGTFPEYLYSILPWPVDYNAYTYNHVVIQLQLLCFSALAFAWLKLSGLYPPELISINLDSDWLYRRLGKRVLIYSYEKIDLISRKIFEKIVVETTSFSKYILGSNGIITKSTTTGTTVLFIGIFLFVFLVFYFFNNL